jgi:hypothetical protein
LPGREIEALGGGRGGVLIAFAPRIVGGWLVGLANLLFGLGLADPVADGLFVVDRYGDFMLADEAMG